MSYISSADVDKINRVNPTLEDVQLGTKLADFQDYAPVIFEKAITSSAATAVEAFTAPFAMRIVDVIVTATATSSSGTLQPLKAAAGMCTAIACATDGAVTHMSAGATAATAANRLLAAGDVVNVIAAGGTAANHRGIVTFIGIRV